MVPKIGASSSGNASKNDQQMGYRQGKEHSSLDISKNSSSDTLDKLLEDESPKVLQELERDSEETVVSVAKPKSVSWSSLPKKGQLVLLTMARLSEPLTQSSLRSYMFYQLRSYDRSLPDSTISWQAGALASAFTAAQFLTAIMWGKAADSEKIGRKAVLLVGLMGTGISALGFGFSSSFWMALSFHSVGGALNGNVGVMRTMVSEMITDKKYQSRAFMLLPMTANIGAIIGPIIGGLLAEPVTSYPRLFGPGSIFGGKDGVQWMSNHPYALPNLVSACFITASALIVVLGLEETHYMLKGNPDWGLAVGRCISRSIKRLLCRKSVAQKYMAVPLNDSLESPIDSSLEMQERDPEMKTKTQKKPKRRRTLPFNRIFTRNVVIVLVARGLLAMHAGTFQNLWYIFLSADRTQNSESDMKKDMFHFTGGLNLPPPTLGLAMSILGGIGIAIQIFLYPPISHKYGTITSFRSSLLIFPLVYFLVPFLAILPSTTQPPLPAAGPVVWAGILTFLGLHVFARMFAIPSATILVNNCCPHPSVLGTVHGVSQSVASGMRMLGPILGGWGFGLGLEAGVVGAAFWVLMGLACLGAMVGMGAREGSGHEIVLEGDDGYEGDDDDDNDDDGIAGEEKERRERKGIVMGLP